MEGGGEDRSLLCPDAAALNVSSVALRRVCVCVFCGSLQLDFDDVRQFLRAPLLCCVFGDIDLMSSDAMYMCSGFLSAMPVFVWCVLRRTVGQCASLLMGRCCEMLSVCFETFSRTMCMCVCL